MRSHSCVSKNCNDMGRTACSLPALPREKASFCATKEGVQLRKVYSWQCPATPMWKGPSSTPRGDQTSFLKAMWVPWAPHGPAVSASFSSPFHRCREIKKKNGWGCMKTEVHLVGLLPVSCHALFVTSLSPSLLKFAVWCSQTPCTFTHFQ